MVLVGEHLLSDLPRHFSVAPWGHDPTACRVSPTYQNLADALNLEAICGAKTYSADQLWRRETHMTVRSTRVLRPATAILVTGLLCFLPSGLQAWGGTDVAGATTL